MDHRDQQAIEDLFARIGDVEQQGAERDSKAETFIAEGLSGQPAAPCHMAQTVQEQALEASQARIAEIEKRASGAGGFIGGL